MTDIFFSYSSKDRERVRPVREALAGQGFDVFWDQQVPAGVDWDTWIRDHLNRSRCAIVFWSETSVASDNVRHEATIARQQGKLVPALIEALSAEKFPMGLYSVQGVNLTAWSGAKSDPEWQKLQSEVEERLMPLWVTAKLHSVEADTRDERARRERAEARARALQEQLAKAVEAQHSAESDSEALRSEVDALGSRIATLESNLARTLERAVTAERVATTRGTELGLATERLSGLEPLVKKLEGRVEELSARASRGDGAGTSLHTASEHSPAPLPRSARVIRLLARMTVMVATPLAALGWIAAASKSHRAFTGPDAAAATTYILGMTAGPALFAAMLLGRRGQRQHWAVRALLTAAMLLIAGFNTFLALAIGLFGMK